MSSFEVKVRKVIVSPHPNADRLELAQVDGFRAVVGKDQFTTGDLAVYIPTGAVVPEDVLRAINLWDDEKGKGRLAGKDGNRVKEAKLRGFLSEGIVCSLSILGFEATEGEDVAEDLGIVKWSPPIPVHLAGEVESAFGYTLNYDIENFKRYPEVLIEGEPVVFTEKIHGTFCCLGYNEDYENKHIVTSKGLSSSGLALKINEANKDNLYVKQHLSTLVDGESLAAKVARNYNETAAYLLGEVFGAGVQDLKYGMDSPTFRLFDVYVGQPGKGRYLDYDELIRTAIDYGIPTVPRLYRGPFSVEKMEEYTSGAETVSGTDACIREGIVIKPLVERRDETLGRVILKSVSEAYLCRKGNTTEFN